MILQYLLDKVILQRIKSFKSPNWCSNMYLLTTPRSIRSFLDVLFIFL